MTRDRTRKRKRGRRYSPGQSRDRIAIVTYRASLAVAALLVALLVLLVVLTFQPDAVGAALSDLGAHPSTPSEATRLTLEIFFGLPLAAGVMTAFITATGIAWIRLWVYVRGVHRYTGRYLATALRPARIELRLSGRHYDGEDTSGKRDEPAPLHRLLRAERQVLLLGEAGTGKTLAVMRHAHQLTRRRALVPLLLGLAPVPFVLSLATYSAHQDDPEGDLVPFIARQAGIFGTRGFVARLPGMVRRRALLLCDGLSEVPLDGRRALATQLVQLSTTTRGRCRIIITAELETYLSERGSFAPLHEFVRILPAPLSEDRIAGSLRRLRTAKNTERPRRGDELKTLRALGLATSVTLPATFGALLTAWSSARPLPGRRGGLWTTTAELLAGRLTHEAAHADGQSDAALAFLARLASALRGTAARSLPVQPGERMGDAVVRWLDDHPPLQPADAASSGWGACTSDGAEAWCRAALREGVLHRTLDGLALGFSNAVLEAAFAAVWLREVDDGIGRLSAELLRPEWALPLLLWAGTPQAAGLAPRLMRLGDTPDTSSLRAGLTSTAAAPQRALAMALAALVEGEAAGLALGTSTGKAAAVAEQHLRDLLDTAQRTATLPAGPAVLGPELRIVAAASGPELVEALARIARQPMLSRLVRAQTLTLLGLLATPFTLEAVIDLLADPDPVLAQAATQALILAGRGAIEPLRAALTSPDERVRSRASEALTQVGEEAWRAALEALDAEDPQTRAAAARTLGALGARQAERALTARLQDDDVHVTTAAAHALGQIGTTSAQVVLRAHLAGGNAARRAAIAEALGSSGDIDAVNSLATLLDDSSGQVRAAAAGALGLLGDEQAVAPLLAHRTDADPWVQNAVVTALHRLGHRA